MTSPDWPALPFKEWESTCDTIHMWAQMVGKTRLALTPLENHWWNVALYVTPRGLSTSAIPYGHESFDAEFDFIRHQLSIRTSKGEERSIALKPRSAADFYKEYMATLHSLGIEVKINTTPDEFDDKTPYDQDERHASYDTAAVERFRRVLVQVDRVLKEFRARFQGKSSPVHFFWGSFDLTVTRFSGRLAPIRENAGRMEREAYSCEEISCGFWPGDRRYPDAAFYAYGAPAPPGIEKEPVKPAAAYWDTKMGEFLLKYEDVRTAESPEQALLDFCQSTYEAAAKPPQWDPTCLDHKPSA